MKNVFNVDMTNNPDNERIDGVQFITQTLDPVLLQQVDPHCGSGARTRG